MRIRACLLVGALTAALTGCNAGGSIAPKPAYDARTNVETSAPSQHGEEVVSAKTNGANDAPSVDVDAHDETRVMTEPNLATDETAESAERPVTPVDSVTPAASVTPVVPATLAAGTVLTQEEIDRSGGEDAFFWVEEISDETFARMEGKSFGADCTVPRENLRYLKVLHVMADGTIKVGEMVVNAMVADEVLDIFHQLYDSKWPIKKMHLIDDYDGSDDASCADGNSSSFNFRKAVNADVLSNHAFGLAIDINTFENPYYIPSQDYVYPAEAASYLDRSLDEPYMIHRGDLCYTLFTERGWDWGGDWYNINDFQHFEKAP